MFVQLLGAAPSTLPPGPWADIRVPHCWDMMPGGRFHAAELLDRLLAGRPVSPEHLLPRQGNRK